MSDLALRAREAVGHTGRSEAPAFPAVLAAGGRTLVGAFLLTLAAWLPFGASLALGSALSDHLGRPASAAEDVLVGMLLISAFVGLALAQASATKASLRVPAVGLVALGGVGLLVTASSAASTAPLVLLGGLALALQAVLVRPLAVEAAPIGGRVRALNALHLGAVAGVVVPALLGTGMDAEAVLSVSGVISVVLAVIGTVISRSIEVGERDEVVVRSLVDPEGEPELFTYTLAESLRRVWARPTLRTSLAPVAMASIGILAMPVMGWFLATDRGGITFSQRPGVVAGVAVVAVLFTVIGGWKSDHRHAVDPGIVIGRAAILMLVGGALTVIAGATSVAAIGLLAVGTTSGVASVVLARLDVVVAAGVPAATRPWALAILNAAAHFGAAATLAIAAGVDARFGPAWAVGVLGVLLLIGGLALRRPATTAAADLDQTVARLLSAQELVVGRRRGDKIPLLEARGIDFAYGQVQVLFGVDFSVDEGEMVALLGTNGAGKSTLLRVISGLGTPRKGSVRLEGADVTFWSPAQRVNAGVTQIPGGKAVFGPMSVVDNLRIYGYALGRDKAAVDRGIEKSFEAFPILSERRNQPAGVLSGGEQQMLALSKALILQPRLLCIDELSLGLAPKIVADLLGMVREINATGTAVVLVEQSVNVALSLAHHAYYMEKGEVRFDGPSDQLLDSDVLRSVYLQGAAKGLGQ